MDERKPGREVLPGRFLSTCKYSEHPACGRSAEHAHSAHLLQLLFHAYEALTIFASTLPTLIPRSSVLRSTTRKPPRKQARPLRLGAAAALLCLGGASLGVYLAPGATLTDRLERELGGGRFIEARLSISRRHASCTATVAPGGTISVSHCPGVQPDLASISALSRRALREVRERGSPDALHTLGLIELLLPSRPRESATRAVNYLSAAARLSARPAPVLADLSAAYLRRAEVAQTPRDLFEGIEAASKALAADSLHLAARFNLALALERAGLVEQAAQEWARTAKQDTERAWAAEARARSRPPPATPPAPAATAPAAEFRSYAEEAPQEARLLATDQLLPQWGHAVRRGDPAEAAARLSAAAAIGDVLGRDGDGSVSESVGAIRARAEDSAALLELAAAHEAYGAAEQARNERRWVDAQAAFEQVLAIPAASPGLRAWAEYGYHLVRYYTGETRDVQDAFTRIAQQTDTLRYPALAARARWSLGLLQVRDSKYTPGAAHLATAARLFRRLGEREHLGAVQSLECEARFGMGDMPAAYTLLHGASANLHPYRASLRLHNHLYAISQITSADGLARAALRVQDEDVPVAARLPLGVQAEAIGSRALALVAAGEMERAETAIRAGEQAFRGLPEDTWEVRWYRQNARLARAGMLLPMEPARAAVQLDSVVAYFDSADVSHRLLPALLLRAEARTTLGDTYGAITDLDRATLVLKSVSSALQSAELRALMLESARESFDRLVMLRVRMGQPDSALAALERGRARFAADDDGEDDRVAETGSGQPGTVLNYALISDTLLIWTVRGLNPESRVEFHRMHVGRDTLLNTIERLRVALELGAGAEAVRSDLGALHDWLIRPVQDGLQREAPLTIVADGEISAAPFAALFDRSRGRYLIQDYSPRFAGTLRDARRPSQARRTTPVAAVLVGDPAFDPRVYPELSRLGGTVAEVRAVARTYPGAEVLEDTAATLDALRRALSRADLLHFAGHAVFDDERPERSYLVLAGGSAGRLDAESLRSMDLHHLRLVVLSACQTQRARSGRSGGFAGLSGALLERGAGGVVGSLWRVDDALTRRLMTEFHRAYVTSGDGANALRSAQLQLLGSSDPSYRSPAAWAGFRYGGRWAPP